MSTIDTKTQRCILGSIILQSPKGVTSRIRKAISPIAVLLMFFLLTMNAQFVWAQITGTISGTVQDSAGAVIPNAQVRLVNESSADTRTVVSNGSGFFTIAGLNPGSYKISIEATTFKTFSQTGIALNPGDTRALNSIVMVPGASSETVTVESAAGEVLPQDSGERTAVLTSTDIERLEIQGRNISELLKILPGVASVGTGTGNTTAGTQLGVGLAPNGTPYRGGSAYLLDGANIIDPGCNCNSIASANPDMTQEVKIQTSNFGADVPNGPVTISAISKSGGARYHGGAYLYARNYVLNANTWQFNQNGTPRAQNYFYYPGGNVGGPVKIPGTNFNRNSNLLFWAGVEIVRQDQPGTPLTSYIPTAAMEAGNFTGAGAGNGALCPSGFSSTATTYCNNLTGTVAPDGTPITGGQIPAQYLDPGAQALLKLFPAPNATPTAANSYTNYFQPTDAPTTGFTYRGRLDYNINDSNKVFISFQRSGSQSQTFARQFSTPANAIEYPGGVLFTSTHPNILTGNYLHVFSSSLTNDAIAALAWYGTNTAPTQLTKGLASTIGYPYSQVFANNGSTLAAAINSPGAQTFPDISQPDDFQGGAYTGKKSSTTFSDDVTYVYRTHTFKAGAYTNRAVNAQSAANYVNGSLSYASGLRVDQGSSIKIGSANPLANFLMGIASGYTQSSYNPSQALGYRTTAFYGMDTWKTTPKLTLILTLRFEHIGNWVGHDDTGLAAWYPSRYQADIASGKVFPGIYWHGLDASVPKTATTTAALQYSPRVGVAYDLYGDGKTIFRGGWGAYRWNDQYNDVAAPLATAQQVHTYNSVAGNAITLKEINAIGKTGNSTGALPGSVTAIDPTDTKMGATYAYSFTVSQQLPLRSLLEIAYVGNQTHNLLLGGQSGGGAAIASDFINQNKIPMGGLFKADPITGAPAPSNPENPAKIADYYPRTAGYGSNAVSVPEHEGYSNYNGLQVSFVKQAGHLSYNLNYTWSKALGIANSVDGFSIRGNYGVLIIDRPNVFNFSYAYDLGKLYKGEHKIIAGATNGWTVSGITTYQSGGNLQALYSQNLGLTLGLNSFNNPLTAKTYYGTPNTSILPLSTCDPRTNLVSKQHVNINCITAPAIGQVGIRQLPYLSGPAYFDSDLAVYKSFHMRESQSLQVRLEAFNFINHPLDSFLNNNPLQLKYLTSNGTSFTPNPSVPVSQFGITATKAGSRVVELAAKYYF
jgi:hypothetical protein